MEKETLKPHALSKGEMCGVGGGVQLEWRGVNSHLHSSGTLPWRATSHPTRVPTQHSHTLLGFAPRLGRKHAFSSLGTSPLVKG